MTTTTAYAPKVQALLRKVANVDPSASDAEARKVYMDCVDRALVYALEARNVDYREHARSEGPDHEAIQDAVQAQQTARRVFEAVAQRSGAPYWDRESLIACAHRARSAAKVLAA